MKSQENFIFVKLTDIFSFMSTQLISFLGSSSEVNCLPGESRNLDWKIMGNQRRVEGHKAND